MLCSASRAANQRLQQPDLFGAPSHMWSSLTNAEAPTLIHRTPLAYLYTSCAPSILIRQWLLHLGQAPLLHDALLSSISNTRCAAKPGSLLAPLESLPSLMTRNRVSGSSQYTPGDFTHAGPDSLQYQHSPRSVCCSVMLGQ
jgi:hypothetical protein